MALHAPAVVPAGFLSATPQVLHTSSLKQADMYEFCAYGRLTNESSKTEKLSSIPKRRMEKSRM